MNFSTLKELKIPEGNVTKITDASGVVLWESRHGNVFGVCWDTSNGSTALTRLTPKTDPYRLVTRSVTEEPKPAVGAGAGSSPFDAFMPWSGVEECNIDTSGAVTARKGDGNFSRDGLYVMVYIPEFYVAYRESGTKKFFYISDVDDEKFAKHPGSGKLVGRYHMCDFYGAGASKTKSTPVTNLTRSAARDRAKMIGNRFRLYDFATYCAIIWLYLVEFADWNCQSKIGRGYMDGNDSAIPSGGTDSMTYHTGRAPGTDDKTAVQYRWIENLWGNVHQLVDGFNANGRTAYYCTDPSKYADDTSNGYTKIGTLPASGYINDLTVTDNGLLIPKTTGGSGTTYIPDYFFSSLGRRVLYVGGNLGDGLLAGLLCIHADGTSSFSDSHISARIMCEP